MKERLEAFKIAVIKLAFQSDESSDCDRSIMCDIVDSCEKSYDNALLKFKEADASLKSITKELEELKQQRVIVKPMYCI